MTGKTRKCPTCGKETFYESMYHPGYGAGDGAVHSWGFKCPICQKGCYEGSYDEIPGFKDSYEGKCCYCGSTEEDRKGKGSPFVLALSTPIGNRTIIIRYTNEEFEFFDEISEEQQQV